MFDFGYILRLVGLIWRFRGRKVHSDIFSETIVRGRCWLNDLDANWHMNNARYLRECDFGRYALLMDNGLWNVILKRRKDKKKYVNLVVSALQSQYRQSIQLGDRFKIRTRLNGWDEKAFYIEQSMILDQNDQIAFLLLIRISLIPRSVTPQMLIDDLQIGSIQSPRLSSSMQILKDHHRLSYEQPKSQI